MSLLQIVNFEAEEKVHFVSAFLVQMLMKDLDGNCCGFFHVQPVLLDNSQEMG